MKLSSGLAGVCAAMAFALAAQAAQAQQYPTEPVLTDPTEPVVNVRPIEEDPPLDGYTPISVDVENANGVGYTVESEVPNGDDYMAVGEVIEVELEYDDVMAALKANEEEALALASEIGVRSYDAGAKSGFVNASNALGKSNSKLTEAEYESVAKYVYVRARIIGRYTASDSWTSRIYGFGRAISGIFDAAGRNFPTIEGEAASRTYYPNGNLKSESRVGFSVRRRDN